MIPPEALGPAGVAFVAIVAAVVLWRKHEADDKDVRTDRDYWRSMALRGVELADKSQTASMVVLGKRSTDA